MRQIEVGVIGTGWCGGIRAEACAGYPAVKALHLAETRPDRLAEVAGATGAATATLDYRELIANEAVSAVFVC
ncbi:MAG TPA: gfo/Idh/MocA family oxidoreductase, partial [Candidatus Dormibacteraeota bacterium]|nr:gfo/Idh/MocA family oxidoreductase [Candidatus Dormibacteraeota bacterium]